MRQSIKRRLRNFPVRSEMKTYMKKELKLIKEGKIEEAKKLLSEAFSVIDMACKKNLIHRNNAARKKSLLAKALNEVGKKGTAVS